MEYILTIFLYIFIFLFGADVGSFLNVLIDRLPKGEQVIKGRSYCDRCHHKLSWTDLFPLFSWIALGGRCRYCHSPISVQYPLVELFTGILFTATFLLFLWPSHGLGIMNYELWSWIKLGYNFWLVSALIVIFVTDLKYKIIPDQIVYPSIIAAFIFQIINHGPDIINIVNPSLSAFGAGLFFSLIILFTRGRGMGVGDVKLVFLMGLILGFPLIIIALYAGFLTGGIFGVILILTGKKKFGQTIAFGPFLIIGTYISLFWGQPLWYFFQKLLGLS